MKLEPNTAGRQSIGWKINGNEQRKESWTVDHKFAYAVNG